MRLYGIPNCDTVKKARQALAEAGISYEFVDFKKQVPSDEDILRWKESFGDWPVNNRGRIYKQIKETFEQADDTQKMTLIQENTSAIKRPILENNGTVMAFGFDKEVYLEL